MAQDKKYNYLPGLTWPLPNDSEESSIDGGGIESDEDRKSDMVEPDNLAELANQDELCDQDGLSELANHDELGDQDELNELDGLDSSLDDEGQYIEEAAMYLQEGLSDLYTQNILSDVDVVIGRKIFHCHKVVLAAVSNYFSSMFVSGMKESVSHTVTLQSINPVCFKRILDYVYRGSNIMSDDSVDELLEAAVVLQFRRLEENCVKYLSANLKTSNCFDVLRLCRMHNCSDIATQSWKLALKKFETVMADSDLMNVSEEILIDLLNDSRLMFKDEDVLCRAIINWVEVDSENRAESLPKLFNFVCLPEVTGDFLYNDLLHNDLVNQFPLLKKLVDDALRCHLIPKEKDSIMLKQTTIRDETKYRRVLLVIGGSITDDDILRNVSCYDKFTSSWYSLESLPRHIGENFATCLLDNRVYLSGGSRSMDTVYSYDPNTNTWSPLPSLNCGRESHAMVSINERLYVLGGRNFKRTSDKLVPEVEMFELGHKSWIVVGKLDQPVEAFASGVIGAKIYIYGGQDETGLTSNISCFDVESKTWSLIAVIDTTYGCLKSIQIKPKQVHLVTSSGEILVHDGVDNLKTLSVLLDFDRDRFAVTPDVASITVAGGISDNVRLDDILNITLCNPGNQAVVMSNLCIPMDGLGVHWVGIPVSYLAVKGMSIGDQEEGSFEFRHRPRFRD